MIQTVNVNVAAQPTSGGPESFLVLSQNENGRQIRFRVLGDDLPAGCTATFSGTKPDGTVYSASGTIDGNFVLLDEEIQMTAVSGRWDAKLSIAKGTENIMTSLIRVTVVADAVSGDSIPSDSELDGIVAECRSYAEAAKNEAYGSPLTAATAAAMTDQSRVYVYTGSETGYTSGHWYYYNGTAWADGGVYNAVAVDTDTTLSIAGKAADAKEVGDQLTSVKEDLQDIEIGYESGSGKTVIQAEVSQLADLPAHKVYYFGAGVTSSQITDAPEYGAAAIVRTDSYKVDNNVNGAVQWFIVVNGRNRVYIRGCVNYTWSAWKQIDIDVNSFMASGVQIVNAGITHLSDLPANKTFYWNGGLSATQVDDAPYYGTPALVYWTGYQHKNKKNGAIQWFITLQTNKIYFRTNFNNSVGKWQILNNWEDDEEYKIFAKVAVAGDSLATGWCYADGIDEQRRRRNIQFCWPTYVGRDAGTEWFNIGQSGYTTRDFLNSSEGYGLNYAKVAGRKPQAYVIGLGVNDRVRPVTLGTLADINTADQTQNADTYYGNYSQIIYQFKQINPQAKIFCLTNPMSVGAEYNAAIRDLVAQIWANNGVYVVDLADNPWTNLYTLDKGITTDLSNSHYAPIAYQKMARIIERSISQVIREHQTDFHDVPYIPYDTASANVE